MSGVPGATGRPGAGGAAREASRGHLAALQRVLAAEHAAVFVYADLGARTSASGTPDLFAAVTAAYTTHRARRDRVSGAVLDEGGDPVAAEPAYALPDDLGTPDAVARAAADLERDVAATYAFWVASAPSRARREAVVALTDAAVRAVGFGGGPERLPGL